MHDAITVRRLNLTFPADLDPVILPGEPEQSYFQIGFSLLLPYLEPYLIRSLNAGKKHVRDPKLATEIDLFNAQEGQHYRQHMRFNQAIRLQARDVLQRLEAKLEADYRRFSERRSLKFNLAYAEGFEAMTLAMTRVGFEANVISRLRPDVRDLFQWHLIEELEHRTVAFDVYQHVYGGYFYRLVVGLFAFFHVNAFAHRVARALIEADPVAFRARWGGPRSAWRRMKPWFWLALRRFLPKVFATYMPWYTPHRIAMPEQLRALGEHYTQLAAQGSAK